MSSFGSRLFPFASLCFLLSCGNYEVSDRPDPTLIEKLVVARSGNQLLVKTMLEQYQIHTVSGEDLSPPLVVENGIIDIPIGPDRTLFGVTTAEDTFFVMERHLADLDGPHNLRDLGGLFTEEGYQVKWGKLFRSDKLSEVSQQDHARLKPLGLATIVDFRLPHEVSDDPDQWPDLMDIEQVSLMIGDSTRSRAVWLAEIRSPDFDPDSLMHQVNRALATDYISKFHQFSQMLLDDGRYPLLYHCTAGKDRTGFASAIILMALGVSRETIIDEYLMSNYYNHEYAEDNVRKAVLFVGVDAGRIRPLLGVRKTFLQGAFDVIDSEYDSEEHFLCEALGLCDEQREQLKSMLLYNYHKQQDD